LIHQTVKRHRLASSFGIHCTFRFYSSK